MARILTLAALVAAFAIGIWLISLLTAWLRRRSDSTSKFSRRQQREFERTLRERNSALEALQLIASSSHEPDIRLLAEGTVERIRRTTEKELDR